MTSAHIQKPPYPLNASIVSNSDSQLVLGSQILQLPGHVYVPRAELVPYLKNSLDVSRLSSIFRCLWFAGRPRHIRPLHAQLLVQRSIIVTERADLHMVWYNQQIYIKPLPAFLLCHDFFAHHLCALPLYADACGLLGSYIKLIRHQSDYRVAVKHGLLPEGLSWAQWSAFAIQVRPLTVSKRYEYGELRLFRLNLIYRLYLGHWICGYHLLHTNFNSFFGSNFKWPLVTFAYVMTVLNAMQVVLASGRQDARVEVASFTAGVVVMVAILGTFCAVAVFFVTLLLYNLARALKSKERVRQLDLEAQAKDV